MIFSLPVHLNFDCDICGKQFGEEYRLSWYKDCPHNDGSGIVDCDFCEFKFATNANLNLHMKLTHRGGQKVKRQKPQSGRFQNQANALCIL